jgi:predicted dehydrogenase
MKRIKVGVIGLGFIGKLHLDALRRIPQVELCAVSSAVPLELENARNVYGIQKCYPSWRDLVLDPEIEAVHDCTPVALHEEINAFCIEHGKHLYSEKPLAMNTLQVAHQLDVLAKNPVANCVGHQYRSNAAIHAMRELYESGACGKLLFVRGRYFQESLAESTDYTKRLVPEDSPMRALSDLGSHLADLIDYLTGTKIKSVCASMVTHYPVRYDGNREVSIKSDDTTMAQIVMSDGTPGMFIVSKTAVGHKNDLSVSMECSKMELTWNQEQPGCFCKNERKNGNAVIFMDPKYCSDAVRPYISLPVGHLMGWCDALRCNMQSFYQSITDGSWTGPVPYTTFRDELSVSRFLDASVISSQEKRWVDVEVDA